MPNFCPECGTSLAATRGSSSSQANKKSAPKATKRKASAYSKRYGAAFKRLAPKYKKKSGGWKKDGFRLCGKAARKVASK